MDSPAMAADLVQRIARVQEMCEALSRPSTAQGARFLVTFDDGSTVEMKDVLAHGREALAEVAALFDVEAPAIAAPLPAASRAPEANLHAG